MRKFQLYGYSGVILMVICWTVNWHLEGLRTHILFFPQWLGLIIFIDAWIYARKGTSLIKRNFKKFLFLFIISIPVWWIFELYNLRNQNWYYQGREYFSNIQYVILASLNFSTVLPAVFEMTELVASFNWSSNLMKGPKIRHDRKSAYFFILCGLFMLILDIWMPQYFYVFMWISIYLIIEGFNVLLNNKSLLRYTNVKNWYPLYMLAIGCLFCGILWELWNFYSYPKWIYNIPFLGFLKIFEMPILGYLGYIPFAFELYAIYMFLTGTKENSDDYIFIQ